MGLRARVEWRHGTEARHGHVMACWCVQVMGVPLDEHRDREQLVLESKLRHCAA